MYCGGGKCKKMGDCISRFGGHDCLATGRLALVESGMGKQKLVGTGSFFDDDAVPYGAADWAAASCRRQKHKAALTTSLGDGTSACGLAHRTHLAELDINRCLRIECLCE